MRLRLLQSALAFALFMLAALPCFAGEVAVLKNGFSIKHVRREIVGDVTRLYVGADGASFVDVPTADIERFEAAADDPADGVTHAKSGASNVSAAKAIASPRVDVSQLVNEASGRYQLDPDFVNSVINAESGFNVRAVSPKGAQGLMQLMPGTASQLGVANAFDAQANVDGGTKYLRELLERYNFDVVKALAAYNAGPQRVERYGGVPPYYETKAYVARIVKDFNRKKIAQEKAAASHERAMAQGKSAQRTATSAEKTIAKRESKSGSKGTVASASNH